MKLIMNTLGFALLLVGVMGFIAPGLMGMHLSVAHNLVHIVTGLATHYFGMRAEAKAAKTFALLFGLVYGLLGVAGLFSPAGQPTMAGMPPDDHLLVLIPNVLEFGTMDSVVHVILGIAYLIVSAIPSPYWIKGAKDPKATESMTH